MTRRARVREIERGLGSFLDVINPMTTTNENKKRRLMMLEDVRVASPCPAKWDEMLGNDQVRFCTGCEKNVYNISTMTREEAEDLIAEKEGDVCVRFFQRADGTIMTQDCSVGAKRKLRKKAALAVASAASMALAALQVWGKDASPSSPPPCELTEVRPVPPPPPVEPDLDIWGKNEPPVGHWVAGGLHVAPEPKKPMTKR